MDEARLSLLRAAGDPAREPGELAHLADSADPAVLIALVNNPSTPTDTLKRLARTPRIGVRKALLDSERCPLVSSVAEDRLAFEGVDIDIFVDERSRRSICRQIIGTAHRAETELLFSDPTFKVLDCLRTLHSLFTIHGGKKRDRKLNRHDYLRFLKDFNARGGRQEALHLPFITMLTGIRLLGQEYLVQVMTSGDPARAVRTLRLLEVVVAGPPGEEGARQQELLGRWMGRCEDWPARLHDYLDRKYRRRAQKRRNRPPRALFQSRFTPRIRAFNRASGDREARIHLPRTDRELRALGASMANCIGSDHNVDDAVDGTHIVLHAHRPGAPRKGATCQFNRNGRLLQARGFANGEADEVLVLRAKEAMSDLLKSNL